MLQNNIGALDYAALKKTLAALTEEYPFLSSYIIGRSCAGRDIPAIRLGRSAEYVLIAAAFHGSEYITETVLLRFIALLCEAFKNDSSLAGFNVRRSLFGRGAIFVPCVNPDGCEIALRGAAGAGALAGNVARICGGDFARWNANLRGVDINHNFSAGWQELSALERESGIIGPAPTRFGGYRPESEPETLALTELCRTKKIRHALALHSQGEVIYWSYGDKIPRRSRKMAEILSSSSGYALSEAEGLAKGGGFKDWFISEFDRPAFTVEMGLGKNPLPIEQAAEITERLTEMLMLSLMC